MVISFIFCALFVRLFVLQVIEGKSLQIKATDQWTRDLTIVAPRGNIYDTTGATLVVSYTTYNVYVRAREVKDPQIVSQKLSQMFSLDFESVYKKATNKKVSESLIQMQIDGDKAQEVYDLHLDGVFLSENSGRFYPQGNLLTQILGFTSIDNDGQTGIEAYYNSFLTGVNGFSYVQSDLQGREIGGSLRYYVGANQGNDIYLTVDSKMQLIVEQTLEKIMSEQKAKAVTGIILNAQDGSVLAMSSKPSFDLNDVPRDNLDELFEQSKIKSVTDIYEPGSTFKILTVASALEEGLTSIDDRFYCPGYRIVDGVKIKCWKTIGHGSQTLKEAFANSCNCCFMDLALRLGKDKFYSYMEKFGLGQKTGIDCSGEQKGILMSKSSVKNVDLARMGFGHAITVTPIQLLSAVACVTNGGSYYSPHIMEKICEGEVIVKKADEKVRNNVISSSTSKIVNELLEFAENKQGKYTFVEGYNVGGKTGTAQKYKESGGIDQGKYISSFIGTYPADNPRYILFVMVDEPSAGAYYGSIVSAPYGREIFCQLFDYLGEEKQAEDVSIKEVSMPYVEGMSLTEGARIIKEAGLEYELDGEGDTITRQLPPQGTILKQGTVVVIVTN